ncbi:MAG: zinc ABC transporter substrate-binding protein [Bacilli bacterium]|nr:zinc ABC transporter substrate-binding protein [Bacilli bacterium]
MKKIIFCLIFILTLGLTGCSNSNKSRISIISTSFPGYDLTRAITKNSDVSVDMLMKPGTEMHDFEPTPQDIINIKNSDMFIYVGGDSDEWINDIVDDLDLSKTKVVKLMDLVDMVEEEIIEGMEEEIEEKEYDEHVWTSPINDITILNKLKDKIIEIDPVNKTIYEDNANHYINELYSIDSTIKDIVKTSKRQVLVFGDRFPFRYFTDEYGLDYYAAFTGCSEQTEASAKTLSFLINKVKEDKIPVVLEIELSSGKIAEAIAKETKAKVLEFDSAHNITQNDFDAGVTIVDIMKKNIEVLKEALN